MPLGLWGILLMKKSFVDWIGISGNLLIEGHLTVCSTGDHQVTMRHLHEKCPRISFLELCG
jgi:hypothetical protein